MIGYVTVGSNDVARSGKFYDPIFNMLGANRVYDEKYSIAWAKPGGTITFSAVTPANGEVATAGNGTMIALQANSEAQVDALYQQALQLGATDEGAPGIRSGGFYCAYVRDPDHNKLNFHFNPNS